jgi:hypothetical protein
MFKTIAAIGLSAGLALSPLAALAQTDQSTAPAAPAAGATPEKAPMKAKTHHMHKKHMAKSKSKKKMEKPMESAPAGGEAPKTQ